MCESVYMCVCMCGESVYVCACVYSRNEKYSSRQ